MQIMSNPSNDNITIPEFIPIFEKIGWLNETPIDYKLLKNKDQQWYYALSINCTAGATADWTYRTIDVWVNWDIETSYNQTILTGLGSTTATVTKTYTFSHTNNVFSLLPWKVMEITAKFPTSTWLLRVDYTGSLRMLKAESWLFDMSQTNTHIVFINSNTTAKDITMKFATSAADRPSFWIFIKIY